MRLPILMIAVMASVLSACTGVRVLPAPPVESYELAIVPGYGPEIRSWGDTVTDATGKRIAEIRQQIIERVRVEGQIPNNGRADVLVLSGGGSDGAYGAGLLNGWTDRGGRPEFAAVTGISTGALIAPYAFLGPDFDSALERFYTNTQTDDVVELQVLAALFGNVLGLTSTSKLEQTLRDAVDADMVDRIAAEHRKGRRLLVGTTNLDAQRPVTWDIGKIAASDDPGRAVLIRRILLASASIPGAFPPVQIVVEAEGQRYAEMHVDGGVTRQLFFVPRGLELTDQSLGDGAIFRLGTIYVVRNTKLAPSYQEIEAGIVPIAQRSISTLIKAAGVADAALIEEQAKDGGFGLSLTAVPESFDLQEQELFDPVYMRALYTLGYESALQGTPWTVVAEPSG